MGEVDAECGLNVDWKMILLPLRPLEGDCGAITFSVINVCSPVNSRIRQCELKLYGDITE